MADEEFSVVLVMRPFSHHRGAEYNNLQRFMEIGMVTYEKFMDISKLRNFFVIVPKTDVATVKNALSTKWPAWPWQVLSEDTLLHPGIPAGWARQQTVKLAVSFLVQTDLYLIIDDDTYLTKPFSGKDLRDVKTGKVLLNRTPIDFPFFFLWSNQLLGYDFDKVQGAAYHMAITPETFVTAEVRSLVKHLIEKYGDKKAWQVHLANHKFTEYALYWIWLMMQGKTDTLYATPGDTADVLYGYATTGPEHDLKERVRDSFEKNAHHWFSFVQSSLPIPVNEVKERVLAMLK